MRAAHMGKQMNIPMKTRRVSYSLFSIIASVP